MIGNKISMKITIETHIGGGKSTIAQLIRETLEAHNIEVSVEDEQHIPEWYADNPQRVEFLAGAGMTVEVVTKHRALPPPPLQFNLYQAAMLLAPDEVELLRQGKKVGCIKRVRERTGYGLRDALLLVEQFQS